MTMTDMIGLCCLDAEQVVQLERDLCAAILMSLYGPARAWTDDGLPLLFQNGYDYTDGGWSFSLDRGTMEVLCCEQEGSRQEDPIRFPKRHRLFGEVDMIYLAIRLDEGQRAVTWIRGSQTWQRSVQ